MYKIYCDNCYIRMANYAKSEFVRRAISDFTGCDESGIKVEYGEHGKPLLLYPEGFYFSVSHTDGFAAAAVSDKPVGVDVECVRSYNPLILKKLTKEERAYIGGGGRERFFEVWCAKEAVLKLTGKGLSGGLSAFSVSTDDKLLSDVGNIHFDVTIRDGICLAVASEK